jgi:microcystin-dependent protein
MSATQPTEVQQLPAAASAAFERVLDDTIRNSLRNADWLTRSEELISTLRNDINQATGSHREHIAEEQGRSERTFQDHQNQLRELGETINALRRDYFEYFQAITAPALERKIENIVPCGTILPHSGPTIPPGYILCDGQVLHPVEHERLYNLLGTRFDSTGSGVPRAPNLNSRTMFGTVHGGEIGTNIGRHEVRLTNAELPSHTHAMTDAGRHSHHINVETEASRSVSLADLILGLPPNTPGLSADNTVAFPFVGTRRLYTDDSGEHTHHIHHTGGGNPFSIVPPSVTVYYIIKL